MPRQVTQATSWPPAPNGKMHLVREDKYGRLWTRITGDGQEHLAVRLRDVAKAYRAKGSYDIPPARGEKNIDITAYHPNQKTWGIDRERRPGILFQYQRTDYQTSEVTTLMDHDGKIVLDEDNHPIRHFPILPLTISTAVEGFRLEAWHRMDSRIEYNDIRARMLVRWPASGGRTGPLVGSFNMRKTRARQTIRCLAWPRTGGIPEKKGCFDMLLRFEMTDAMKAQNSTRLLTDLTSAEEKALSSASYGTGFIKAGNNALSQTERSNKWQSAAIQADEKGDILHMDPKKYHQYWIHVRGFQLPIILAKSEDEIFESTIQGPSTFQNPSRSNNSHSMHGSQSVFPVDTRSAAENPFRAAHAPSSSRTDTYLGNSATTSAQSSRPLSSNSGKHGGDQVIGVTSNDTYIENQVVSADGPGYRPEIFRRTQRPNRALENARDEGRSISSGDDGSSPNGVQQSKKRRRQSIDSGDIANEGPSTSLLNQHDLFMAPSPSHPMTKGIPRSCQHASHDNTVASNKRQKVIASDTIQRNVSKTRSPSTTQAEIQLVQGQCRPAVSRRRQEIAQGSHASVDSQVWARVSSPTLVQAGNHQTCGVGSPLYDQADHHPAYSTNSAGFNTASSLQPHDSSVPGFNTAHIPRVQASVQFTQSGDFETRRPNLEYSNGSRNCTLNEAFPAKLPNRSPKNHMVDMIPRLIGQDLVGRRYGGYMSPLLSSQVEEPPERQTYAAPNEYISPPIPSQASYTDAGGFEDMDLLEPWQPLEDLTGKVGGFSTSERRNFPPGQFQLSHDALGHSMPHEAAGVNGFRRGDSRDPFTEQNQSTQFDNHDMFAAYTVDDDFAIVQTPELSKTARPADPIIEGNLPFMEAHAPGSSSTMLVEHLHSSDAQERVPRKDAESAATVSVVKEEMTQSEELGQPWSAEAEAADPDVKRNVSTATLDEQTNAGMWETAVDENSLVRP